MFLHTQVFIGKNSFKHFTCCENLKLKKKSVLNIFNSASDTVSWTQNLVKVAVFLMESKGKKKSILVEQFKFREKGE